MPEASLPEPRPPRSPSGVVEATDVAGGKLPPWRHLYNFMKDSVQAWIDDYAPSMGAALSYYTLFSIAPLLLIVISVAGLVFGEEAARGHISATLSSFLGAEGAIAIEGLLKSVSLNKQTIAGTLVGVTLLLVGATSVFAELQNALDRIWRSPERNKPNGLIGLLRARVMSFGLILGFGFLMIVSLIASAALTALGEWWAPLFGGWDVVLQGVNFVVSFGLVTAVFAMIYKLMPSVRIAWRDVWVGAVATAALFTVGKLLIGLYIGQSGVTSGFGAASSVVLLLVWVYYSAQIFLVGAEFTWVYAHRFGSRKTEADRVERRSPERRCDDDATLGALSRR
jgi:membrane protein